MHTNKLRLSRRTQLIGAAAIGLAALAAGCDDDSAIEEAGDNTADAIEDTADATDDATDAVEDATDDVGDAVDDLDDGN